MQKRSNLISQKNCKVSRNIYQQFNLISIHLKRLQIVEAQVF